MRLDSHQHFWRYSVEEYPWMREGWPLRRDFLPEHLAPLLHEHGFEGCIAVQARQSLEETRWLLELAQQSPFIKGVVGWLDLCAPEIVAPPKLVGVRHVVQDEPDDYLSRADFRHGISQLRAAGLTYDLLVYPRQLPAAIDLVRAFPEQLFVLDHLGKPPIRDGALSPWREHIQALAALPNVMCKVSGLVTEARWHDFAPADFRPYLDVAFEAFGVDRLMYGSDWPVALLAASYEQVFALVRDYIAPLGDEAATAFFGRNAARFYGLT